MEFSCTNEHNDSSFCVREMTRCVFLLLFLLLNQYLCNALGKWHLYYYPEWWRCMNSMFNIHKRRLLCSNRLSLVWIVMVLWSFENCSVVVQGGVDEVRCADLCVLQVFFASVRSGGSSQVYFMTLGRTSLLSWWRRVWTGSDWQTHWWTCVLAWRTDPVSTVLLLVCVNVFL